MIDTIKIIEEQNSTAERQQQIAENIDNIISDMLGCDNG
jgi:phenylpyruvate tautomerase PptA (4-oxalocrotonate tautomerase family)